LTLPRDTDKVRNARPAPKVADPAAFWRSRAVLQTYCQRPPKPGDDRKTGGRFRSPPLAVRLQATSSDGKRFARTVREADKQQGGVKRNSGHGTAGFSACMRPAQEAPCLPGGAGKKTRKKVLNPMRTFTQALGPDFDSAARISASGFGMSPHAPRFFLPLL
jgi:hypothetical protein